MNQVINLWSTADLTLAGVVSLYFPLDSLDKSNPRKTIFYFQRCSELDTLIQSYWSGELKVPPLSYAAQLKNLKTRIYSED